MDFWTAVVIIVAIGCFTGLRLHKHNAGISRASAKGDKSEYELELEQQVEKLRQRIAVLERIATDEQRGRDLAHEIESLRD